MLGRVFSLSYETALVQLHDFHRRKVGGIPALSFLIATRIDPAAEFDIQDEDASAILLRVMDRADLPSEAEATCHQGGTQQGRVSGNTSLNWESDGVMDPETSNLLSFAGLRCRVVGTFYVRRNDDQGQAHRESTGIWCRYLQLLS